MDSDLKSVVDSLPHNFPDDQERLLQLKAEVILKKLRFSGELIRVATNTYKVIQGERHIYVHLAMQKGEGMTEGRVIARPSVKGLSGIKHVMIRGECYYEFESLI